MGLLRTLETSNKFFSMFRMIGFVGILGYVITVVISVHTLLHDGVVTSD